MGHEEGWGHEEGMEAMKRWMPLRVDGAIKRGWGHEEGMGAMKRWWRQ